MTTEDIAREYDLLEHETLGFPAHRPDVGDDWSPEDDWVIADMLGDLNHRAAQEAEDAIGNLRADPESVEIETPRIECAIKWLTASADKRRSIAKALAEEHREAQDYANAIRAANA